MQLFLQSGCSQQSGTFLGRDQALQTEKLSTEESASSEDTAAKLLHEMPQTSRTLGPESVRPQDAPPAPCTGGFDWIQFRNGEWLKGEIRGLLRDKFSFESDELENLELDWDDIYAVCSPRPNTCVFERRKGILGTLRVTGDAVIIETPDGERHYNRADLDSIIPGGLTEWDYWSGKVSVGASARSGNTHQSDITSYLKLQRRSPGLRSLLEYTGNYGSFEGVETINNQQTYVRHDIFLDRKVYVVAPIAEYYRDKFQNIAYRLTPGAGLGYQLMDRGNVEWDIGGGGGYQYTRFSRVEPGEDSSAGGGALLAGTNLNWDVTKRVDLSLSYRTTVGLSEAVSGTHHALLMFSVDAWKNLDLNVSFTWDRIESPQPREDGSVPDRDDFRIHVGIGWEF